MTSDYSFVVPMNACKVNAVVAKDSGVVVQWPSCRCNSRTYGIDSTVDQYDYNEDPTQQSQIRPVNYVEPHA